MDLHGHINLTFVRDDYAANMAPEAMRVVAAAAAASALGSVYLAEAMGVGHGRGPPPPLQTYQTSTGGDGSSYMLDFHI